ncbi:39S ribosomal protein L51, mitochondrial-like isoform X2 [Salmo trutta]|uniref:39S ribosomal protein L51, mitochondrial-like isoform X2 n=1 Tax=Salmo trutta TaxID=8032 RepID=UPI00113242F8|nr:39S ribosomal protein L51, mitochondrial-like isoform X2 [Salmo trutta]
MEVSYVSVERVDERLPLHTTRQISTGDFKAHPKDLIVWVKGFRGNELQRLMRKKRMVGDRMMTQDKHDMEKRICFLYGHFNRFGKHR